MKIKLISESDKRFLFLFYVIIIIIFIYWSVFAFLAPRLNPMRREDAEVMNYILTITPIGMNIEDAINVIERNRHLELVGVNRTSGFVHPRSSTIYPRIPRENWPHIVGEQSIRAGGGNFWPADFRGQGLLLRRVVSVYWAFDEYGKLTEVYVRISDGK